MLFRSEVLNPCLVTWWLEWDHHDAGLRFDDLMTRLKLWRPIIGRHRSADRGRAHVKHKTETAPNLTELRLKNAP